MSLVLYLNWTYDPAVYQPWSSGHSRGRGSLPLGMMNTGKCHKGPSSCDECRIVFIGLVTLEVLHEKPS